MTSLEKQSSRAANRSLEAALGMYRRIESDCMSALESTGVTFASYDGERIEVRRLLERLEAIGARVRNGGASVVLGPMSRACVACTGPCVSRSFAVTNNCHRDCYFCFNPNQEEFAYYCEHPFPWRRQLDDLAAESESPVCIALTGGEPLLMFDETCAFFERAGELFPQAHLRLYTSGDLLDEGRIARLASCGLDEIRFSVKQDDPEPLLEKVLSNMALAQKAIPAVMVEMPVIPGTEGFMKGLILRLDDMGVQGINLLEFAYPMWNWPVYESLGLELRNPPWEVFFDYSYAGTLPVQGSEELCLELMLWAHEQGCELGLHYCSLENKHRAQVRNLNEPHARMHPCYAFDREDYFLKTGMVFGPDRAPVRRALRALGCSDFVEDAESDSTSFHPRWLKAASAAAGPDGLPTQPCVSYNLSVEQGWAVSLRELKLEPFSEDLRVSLDDRGGIGNNEPMAFCFGTR